jgi:hypothetical protein
MLANGVVRTEDLRIRKRKKTRATRLTLNSPSGWG